MIEWSENGKGVAQPGHVGNSSRAAVVGSKLCNKTTAASGPAAAPAVAGGGGLAK